MVKMHNVVDSRHQSEHNQITIHLWIVQIVDFLLKFLSSSSIHDRFCIFIFFSLVLLFLIRCSPLGSPLLRLLLWLWLWFILACAVLNSEHEITNRERRCDECELSNFHFVVLLLLLFFRHFIFLILFAFHSSNNAYNFGTHYEYLSVWYNLCGFLAPFKKFPKLTEKKTCTHFDMRKMSTSWIYSMKFGIYFKISSMMK